VLNGAAFSRASASLIGRGRPLRWPIVHVRHARATVTTAMPMSTSSTITGRIICCRKLTNATHSSAICSSTMTTGPLIASLPGGALRAGAVERARLRYGERLRVAWIFDIDVAPEHRGRGYGRALLQAAEREVEQRGVKSIGLNVFGAPTM
jgi:hypothetical protein